MPRSLAALSGPGISSAARSWVDCTIDMAERDLRWALVPGTRSRSSECLLLGMGRYSARDHRNCALLLFCGLVADLIKELAKDRGCGNPATLFVSCFSNRIAWTCLARACVTAREPVPSPTATNCGCPQPLNQSRRRPHSRSFRLYLTRTGQLTNDRAPKRS
jgi:hypothetical protein